MKIGHQGIARSVSQMTARDYIKQVTEGEARKTTK